MRKLHPLIKRITSTDHRTTEIVSDGERQRIRQLVAGACCHITEAQAEQIAETIIAQRSAGLNSSVWHCSSIVFGTLARCPCGPCTQARGEGAGAQAAGAARH